jgi:hypothetical protein
MENLFFNILLAVLPSVVVFLTAFYIIKKFMENEQRRTLFEMKTQSQKVVTPVRLQAYERIALFLERINPQNMIMRVHKTGMSGRLLQTELLKNIRAEYEHNLAQQVYMSSNAWKAVRAAKEETIKLLNIAATKVPDDATGTEYARIIFELSGQLEQSPSDFALDFIKKEIKSLF